jgi:hypothetical protein
MNKEQQKFIFVWKNKKENSVENVPPLKSCCHRQPLDLFMSLCWLYLRLPSHSTRLIACPTVLAKVLISVVLNVQPFLIFVITDIYSNRSL